MPDPGRGVEVTELLRGLATDPVVILFGLVTQLGDGWFLFAFGGVLYVTGDELPRLGIDRRRGLFVLSLVLTYVALLGVFKNFFQLPRPAGAGVPPSIPWAPASLTTVVGSLTTAEGPGFPSGHALGTTMVWGGFALVFHRGTVRQRIGTAAVIVGLVSFSRLVLGVHFLVDVVVGIALGILVLGGLYWLSDRGTNPERVLAVAVTAGIAGLFVHLKFDSVAASGGAIGGWLVWRGIAEATPAHPTDTREVLAGFLVLAAAGGLFGILTAFEPGYLLTFFGAAIATGVAVAAPLLGERLA